MFDFARVTQVYNGCHVAGCPASENARENHGLTTLHPCPGGGVASSIGRGAWVRPSLPILTGFATLGQRSFAAAWGQLVATVDEGQVNVPNSSLPTCRLAIRKVHVLLAVLANIYFGNFCITPFSTCVIPELPSEHQRRPHGW